GDCYKAGIEIYINRVHALDPLHGYVDGVGAGCAVHAEDGHIDVPVFGVCGGGEKQNQCEYEDLLHGEILSICVRGVFEVAEVDGEANALAAIERAGGVSIERGLNA